jgi:hypothetical protein
MFNLTNGKDVGFVNFENRDLHLKANSPAAGFMPDNSPEFPIDDIDGDVRQSTNLDAGADEINS